MCCNVVWVLKIFWEWASRLAKFCEMKICEILSHSVFTVWDMAYMEMWLLLDDKIPITPKGTLADNVDPDKMQQITDTHISLKYQ